MAGSASKLTYDDGVDGAGLRARVHKVIMAWTSDASAGTVTDVTRKIVGRLIKAVSVPGSPAPTDNYTVTITETANGNDVLANSQVKLASNQKAAATVETYFLELNAASGTPLATDVAPIVCDTLTIAISGAGNSKQGTLTLYYEV